MSDQVLVLEQVAHRTAESLAVPLPSLPQDMTCGEAYDWFLERPNQRAAAILDGEGFVVGLANRLQFLARYAKRYYPELYSRSCVLKLANPKPLVVDRHLTIAELGATLAFEQPDALIECFVVTAEGRYLGIATGETLMRSKVDLLMAQEAELRKTLLRLSEASKAKSSFLALMSHELRTPLNAIIGFSEVLLGEYFGPLGTERYRDYAADIHGAGRHLLALINDILDLSKAESGKFDLHPRPIDMDRLVNESLKFVTEKANAQGLRTEVKVGPGLPLLFADALRVKQVLVNLISNAVKFTPSGAITVSVEIAPSCEMVVSVADTGVGMAPEAIPLALEPFQQVDSSLGRKFEGTGLGLPLAKSLVEYHGGRFEIESVVNVGTTVRAWFPSSRVCWPDAPALSA